MVRNLQRGAGDDGGVVRSTLHPGAAVTRNGNEIHQAETENGAFPMLRVDDAGIIRGASDGAVDLFGPCVGRRCHEIVRPSARAKSIPCSPWCAGSQFCGGGAIDQPGLIVRGRGARLVCSRVGDEIVVAVVHSESTPPMESLTPREIEVLQLVAQGLTNRRIGRRLSISQSTVRTHIEHILAKFGARNRAEAVARAVGCGALST